MKINLWHAPILGFPRGTSSKELTYQCQRHRFDPRVRKIPWSRKCQAAPVFLPGKYHGQNSLVGYRHGAMKSEKQLSEHMAPVPRRVNLCGFTQVNPGKCWIVKGLLALSPCQTLLVQPPLPSSSDSAADVFLVLCKKPSSCLN